MAMGRSVLAWSLLSISVSTLVDFNLNRNAVLCGALTHERARIVYC
jgi:hypothetical protein